MVQDLPGLYALRDSMEGLVIPEEKRAVVARALQEAFGVAEFEEIRRMTKGLSSDLVYRIVVRGLPYLLRVMTQINERMDPGRIFACMRAASDADLTPRVLHADTESGISITDFVEEVPLMQAQALVLLPGVLRCLHALPPFPKVFNYVMAHKLFIWRFRTAGLLAEGEIEEAFTGYEQICAAYPRLDADMVSSHLDLKPENMLFDGQRIWLVDWQAGFVNDRYFDLAVAANYLVANGADEAAYLESYFVRAADEYECARFFLMRQALHLFSAAVFLLLGSAGKPVERSTNLPSFEEFHRRIWAGEVNLADNAVKVECGMVHWERLHENLRQVRFEESLRIVSSRHADEEEMRRLLPIAK